MPIKMDEAAAVMRQNAIPCSSCKEPINPLMVIHKPGSTPVEQVMRMGESIMLILICVKCGQAHGASLTEAIKDQNNLIRSVS
jgi:hypothetical protein